MLWGEGEGGERRPVCVYLVVCHNYVITEKTERSVTMATETPPALHGRNNHVWYGGYQWWQQRHEYRWQDPEWALRTFKYHSLPWQLNMAWHPGKKRTRERGEKERLSELLHAIQTHLYNDSLWAVLFTHNIREMVFKFLQDKYQLLVLTTKILIF